MCWQIYVEKSKAPLLLNSCEFDDFFPKSMSQSSDEKFANFKPGYKRTYWEGAHHGFATRGDLVCFHVLVLGHIDPHFIFLHSVKQGCDRCQGRRIQGYCRMVHQLHAVKGCDLSQA